VVAALRARGVEHVLVSNVDNLGATLDPVVLGAHLEAVEAGAALSVEVVRRAPGDAGGCVAELAGRPAIVESFRLPPETSLDDYPFFNTNTLWITLDALEREYPLSWFPVKRTIPWPASGELPVIQFEQLIGQITEFAPTRCLRVDRARFLPIKTRAELDAAQPAMRAIVRDVGLDPGPEPPAAEPSPTATPGLLYKPPAMADALDHYLTWRVHRTELDIELDFLDAQLDEPSLTAAAPRLEAALDAMHRLESGAVANIDEGRMVGHYWLREPERAPDPAIAAAITASWRQIEEFAAAVAEGRIAGDDGRPFTGAILVGIGGSALGPQLLEAALAPRDCGPGFRLRVLDNTDPAGIQDLLDETGNLAQTLILVVSKSGSTVETRNGMLELRAACARQAIDFARRAVAVTCEGSALDQLAEREGWLARFPMWDWVGGRTSVMSPVGLLPAALLGLDWRGLLRGAAAMDHWGRVRPARRNPAALLAWMWHQQGSGRGLRDMVILPYKDRLALLSRYLQQLVMESLGKRLDRKGREVWQGLSVYGNKGSTDQHAYVQQLRDGLHNFFVLFLRVLRDDAGGFGAPTRTGQVEVEPQVSSGDCLDGFYQGTRAALSERGRASATIVLPAVDAVRLGALIALFERAVGIYAELIDVNAYHQPGVEAGKQAAKSVLALQVALLAALPSGPGKTCRELAEAVGADPLAAWQVLRHLAANGRVAVDSLVDPTTARFSRAS
ncbi:MAG TPA: glucose-6-phosphate isomerase, partial [Nannocystis sp.]